MKAIVSAALHAVDDYVPEDLPFDNADLPLAIAPSAIRRVTDLVAAKLKTS